MRERVCVCVIVCVGERESVEVKGEIMMGGQN